MHAYKAQHLANDYLAAHAAVERPLAHALASFFVAQARTLEHRVRLAVMDPHNPASALARVIDQPTFARDCATVARPGLTFALAVGASAELRGVHASRSLSGLWTRGPTPLPARLRAAVDAHADLLMAQPFWVKIAATVASDLLAAWQNAVKSGVGEDEVAKVVLDALGGADESLARARCIARTECTGAIQYGGQSSRDVLANAGLIDGKEWVAVRDADTRDTHLAAHAQRVANDQSFAVGNESAMYPGDVKLTVGERVNCRCVCVSFRLADD